MERKKMFISDAVLNQFLIVLVISIVVLAVSITVFILKRKPARRATAKTESTTAKLPDKQTTAHRVRLTKNNFVTISGKVPLKPKSIFHTKKFIVTGSFVAFCVGVLYYLSLIRVL